MCGEHVSYWCNGWANHGSSPRVRGTLPCLCRARSSATVHPRVCGEHSPRSFAATTTAGSSPRVRGTLLAAEFGAEVRRFIPACAGNTLSAPRLDSRSPVHPRVCGEHLTEALCQSCKLTVHPRVCGEHTETEALVVLSGGSSPRVRGTPGTSGRRTRPLPVHPRVCGEHDVLSVAARTSAGSSPRVRGTHSRLDGAGLLRRFIPACAGNTHG